MSAVDHLSDLQFKFTAAKSGPHDLLVPVSDTLHQVTALTPEGREVGNIGWNQESGRVEGVGVVRDRRRQGIGTRLWYEAHTNAQREGLAHPVHSDVQFPDGKAWAAGMTNRPRGATTRKPKAAPSPDQTTLF